MQAATAETQPAPPPEPAPVAAPPPPAPAPAAPAASIAVSAEPPKPLGPEASCSEKKLLAYFVCMERACLKRDLQSHPDCLKWRKEAKRD
ncbi:hypothetical protein RA210_U10001 [Rubrivivax sp. A210]|nr:hypothetical protein RA210_U10001 [Rubrivivax sp. A210]